MSVEVIIPWRDSGCAARKRALDFVYRLYKDEFSNVTLVDSDEEDFNRANARNRGVEDSKANIVVVADSDLFVPVSQVREAIDVAKTYRGQVRPFTSFGHLSETSTRYFLSNGDHTGITDDQFETLCAPWPGLHGGSFVMLRRLWLEVGGMDEGFIGWGGEDNAFNIRCETKLKNPVKTVNGYAFHLFHPYRRRMSRDNALLLQSYFYGEKS